MIVAQKYRGDRCRRWLYGSAEEKRLLSAWPVPRKANWVQHVATPHTEAELAAIRRSLERGTPFGEEVWLEKTVQRLGLGSTLRPRGRPKIETNGS